MSYEPSRLKQVLAECQCYACRIGRSDEPAPEWVHRFLDKFWRTAARREREEAYQARLNSPGPWKRFKDSVSWWIRDVIDFLRF